MTSPLRPRPPTQARAQNGGELWRLFVAIELPDAWKAALGELQDRMRAAIAGDSSVAHERVRWVKPESMHLTLKFLGEVPSGRMDPVDWALKSAISEPLGMEVALGEPSSFGDERAPRLLLATIEVAGVPLAPVIDRIETYCQSVGFPREKRRFFSHVTLARFGDEVGRASRMRIATISGQVPMPDAPSFTVDHVSLIRSYLEPGGARYEQFARYPA